jgi:hypothetical protein
MERYTFSKSEININKVNSLFYIIEFDNKNSFLNKEILMKNHYVFYKFDILKLNIFFIESEKELNKYYKNPNLEDYDGYEITFIPQAKYKLKYKYGNILKNFDKINFKKIDLSIKIQDNKVEYFLEKLPLKNIKEEPGYYHFSDFPIYKKDLKEFNQSKKGVTNPSGLWYAINFDYYRYVFFATRTYCYKFDISKLNIKKIKNIDDLLDFHNKYSGKSLVLWEKVKKDYDGVQINKKTLDKIKELKDKIKESKELKDKIKESKELKDKIKESKELKEKEDNKYSKLLWAFQWDEASGVILKNYDKLEMKKINIKIIIVIGKKKFYVEEDKNKIIFLAGSSSAGKTSLIKNYILSNFSNINYISSDDVFEELKLEFPRTPYAKIKTLVPERFKNKIIDSINLNEKIKKDKNKINLNEKILIDDIKLDLLDSDIEGIYSILIFTNLNNLAKNAFSRNANDRRPLDSVLRSFTNIYTSEPLCEPITKISRKEIKNFLDLDDTLSEKVKEKALISACEELNLTNDKQTDIYPRKKFNMIINTTNLSQSDIYNKIKYLFL